MTNPYVGEIRLFPWNWPPKGWGLCNGALLSIAQNSALFSLLGTTYGGNGVQTFGLPDLRGRSPINMGPSFTQGEVYGVEQVTITTATMPLHGHTLFGVSTAANTRPANGHYLATANPNTSFGYATSTTPTALNATATSQIGGTEPHNNIQPYLVLNYCIALIGVYPSRN